ncbi:monovalent cation/H(+) antiporter subunit G [Mycobacterium sp. pUA109]|uniref:monovalent cation/H(+) antiporter subunit G n=1 Tax=Mycobacterium sp. pUA109 TaxID=3238982 RepID=UPI00351AC832
MTGPVAWVGWGLVFAGVLAMVVSALAAAARPAVFDRLHLLTVTTSVGAPLLGLGLVLRQGWTAASAMIVLITVVVLATAPVMSAATARLTGQYAGVVERDSPS